MNRLEQIIEFLREQPEDSFLRYALAQEYAKREDWVQAEENYLRLLQADSAYLATYYHLAVLWRSQGRLKKPKTCWIKA